MARRRQVVDIVTDVTAHQPLPEATHRAEALHEADRLKAELLATVSHELRNPLTSIKGYAATLLRHERRLPREEKHEFLLAIVEASDRLEVIIDRLLEMSQLATGTTTISRSPVDMRRLAADAVAVAREHAAKTAPGRFSFTLRTDGAMADQSEVLVEVDPRYMREVLDNLLENAVKYSPNGGTVEVVLRRTWPDAWPNESAGAGADQDDVGPDIEVRPAAAALEQPHLEVIVRDVGVGIPPEHLGRIFDQFHRVDTRLTREVDGLGLGLALCQRIVELHDGRIWAESGPGLGSEFHVLLPLPIGPDEASESFIVKE